MSRTRIITLGVAALVIAAVCIRLGLWQLDRLQERRADNARIAAGIAGEPVEMESVAGDSTRSRALRVRLRGVYDFDNEVVLINRSRDGAPGVNILTPVRLPGRDTAVLVNRGWVYAPDGATVDLARWREPADAYGTAYVSWMPALSGAADVRSAPSPADNPLRRAARLDRDAIGALVPYPIAPYQLVLLDAGAIDNAGVAYGGAGAGPLGTAAPSDPTRPIRIPLPALDEGAHQSYAIQWFSFAAIALVGTAAVIRGERIKRRRDSAL